jgi:hypothetical protein
MFDQSMVLTGGGGKTILDDGCYGRKMVYLLYWVILQDERTELYKRLEENGGWYIKSLFGMK